MHSPTRNDSRSSGMLLFSSARVSYSQRHNDHQAFVCSSYLNDLVAYVTVILMPCRTWTDPVHDLVFRASSQFGSHFCPLRSSYSTSVVKSRHPVFDSACHVSTRGQRFSLMPDALDKSPAPSSNRNERTRLHARSLLLP